MLDAVRVHLLPSLPPSRQSLDPPCFPVRPSDIVTDPCRSKRKLFQDNNEPSSSPMKRRQVSVKKKKKKSPEKEKEGLSNAENEESPWKKVEVWWGDG